MKVMTQWMRVLVAGVALTGCIEPMEPVPGQNGMLPQMNEQAYVAGETPLTTTPPTAIMYSRGMDTRTLWGSASARRFVHVVAYTLPPDAMGITPPPRFRAFAMDMATRSFLFTIDGERASLGLFSDRMLADRAVVIVTPAGFNYSGSCTAPQRPMPGRVEAAQVSSDAGTTTVCGTQPIQQLPPVEGQEGGHDWLFNWSGFQGMAVGLSGGTFDHQFPGGTVVHGSETLAE